MQKSASIFPVALAFCLFNAAIPNPAFAEFYPASAPLTDVEISERLSFLDQRLKSQKSDAELWEYGWGAFNGGTMAYNAFSASQDTNRKDRNTDIIEAVEGLTGVADMIFRPLPALDADSVCKGLGPGDRAQCLSAEETLVRRSAERANEPYQIMPHVGTLATNLVAGALIWRFGSFARALEAAIPGELIGEAQIWTLPHQPANDYDDYRLQFRPLIQTDRSKSSTLGVQAAWHF
jgi:hypothetical protein